MQNNVGIYASQISGKLWAPTGAYDALATVTVPSGGVASVTFAGIPTGYKHLQVRALVQSNRSTFPDGYFMRVGNGSVDSGSNYSWHNVDGDGSGAYADARSAVTAARIGTITGQSATSMFAGTVTDILDYANTNKNKTVRSLFGYDTNGGGVGQRVGLFSAGWYSTTAINIITIYPEIGSGFQQYSSFALYGIK
jgi:hypothetical protein